MAKRPRKRASRNDDAVDIQITEDEHPDYIGGSVGDDDDGEAPQEIAGAEASDSEAISFPRPTFPRIPGPILPRPFPPWRFCSAVSGRYRSVRGPITVPGRIQPRLPVRQPLLPAPNPPFGLFSVTARVDVDRFFPQQRVSLEVNRRFPRSSAHVIAEVTSDACLGFNNRRVEATITYRDGTDSLIPGDSLVFEAKRGQGFGYGSYTLSILSGGTVTRTYPMRFESRYFDPVEFEVDRVENADPPTTRYTTGDHPNRPADLPNETLHLETVYRRAGFDASRSPNASEIPLADAGSNGTWSDAEMHNAMVTYWSRFADRPQWALWVLFAARHDRGRSLGGIMFDDIGNNHRQGTAIFTDSFIQDVPAGDPDPAAWRRRMVFWTAIHEMGHAFNLAHAWQKAMGNPWIPLANDSESRSYMNYPFRVNNGEDAFFADFRFRFSDDELVFLRHAPRRFVQMGNEDWFENHGFEQDSRALTAPRERWDLKVRSNRPGDSYRFLEPVMLELKLKNVSGQRADVDAELLSDGRHVGILVQRDGGKPKKWRAFATHCHREDEKSLSNGESIYGAHFVGASTSGWLIDEPGFYRVQAAVSVGEDVILSNVLRLYVAPPVNDVEAGVAPDYFEEAVGRVIAFGGAPDLESANDTLRTLLATCPDNPASTHATVALESVALRAYKKLSIDPESHEMRIVSNEANPSAGLETMSRLIDEADQAADTLGHIRFFGLLDTMTDALMESGADQAASRVQSRTVEVMRSRKILASILAGAERKQDRMR